MIILMGVSGVGKTTIGKLLAEEVGWDFLDADDFHPPENKEKMRKGSSLGDQDRMPWLHALSSEIQRRSSQNHSAIIACSALKEKYREILIRGSTHVKFVYLKGNKELIQNRLQERQGHFMDPKLLDSQFADLEEPTDAVEINVIEEPRFLVKQIRERFGLL